MIRVLAESPRRAGAREFAVRYRLARRKRGISVKRLASVAGVNRGTLQNYAKGHSLPSLETARRLAEVLVDDELVGIVRRSRTYICPVDHREFTFGGNTGRLYCSIECRNVAIKARAGVQANRFVAERRLAVFAGAVDAFCRTCEPEGVCADATCPLRAVSPLPLGLVPPAP
jgi:transcriptional regulator with XRE-family HTH domain